MTNSATRDARAVLNNKEMRRADAAALALGMDGATLMENAGVAVARAVIAHFRPAPTVVLCGPGNNGGDGYVAARRLAEAGWPVTIAALVPPERLAGDAAAHARRWRGPVESLGPRALDGQALAIDALFGAGLARPLEGPARAVVEAMGGRRLACVAVDVPSGVDGDSGAVCGAAPRAQLTVTFFRKKPAHLLVPGRVLCGETIVAEIGIPDRVLAEMEIRLHENGPALWRGSYP
ncbi:MAG: NAD(P)H-hydrate epimerase, partial [Alphaproteobacteria bacterium]